MNVEEWFEKNKYKSESFRDIDRLVKLKQENKDSISVVIPTLNEEKTVAKVIQEIKIPLMDKKKLVDEIIVIDSGSTDNTKEVAEQAGAKFVYSKDVLKKYEEIKGKGENLWKSVHVAKGSIICWVDADIKNIHPRFVYGLIGPLLTNKNIKFTKAFYQRPIKVGEELAPLGGGRVTELLIRPLFNMYFPRLSGFIQPLSGEYAGRREVLEKIPFFTGYGVETAMLIDIQKKFGLRVCAQVDLKKRIHRNQNIQSLSKMSFGILGVFAKRANALGKLILVRQIKQKLRIIEAENDNYKIRELKIVDKQRPPMITIPEYRRKFKKEPSWYYI
ncbi:MAG: glucosyl-3-phosphoglycerate synthase [Candidatus Woesearchaeota archaeon]